MCFQKSNDAPLGVMESQPAKNLVVGARLTPILLTPAKQDWGHRSPRPRYAIARIEGHVFGEPVRRISLHTSLHFCGLIVVTCSRF